MAMFKPEPWRDEDYWPREVELHLKSTRAPFYANKRWGHGRVKQLLVRMWCRIRGHLWKAPRGDIQHCQRLCGGMRRA